MIRQTACPWCKALAEAEFADTGVGLQQMAPFYCVACGSQQFVSPEERAMASFEEQQIGWWAPVPPDGDDAEAEIQIIGSPLDL